MKAKKPLVSGTIMLVALLVVCVGSVVAPVIGILIAPPRSGQSFRRYDASSVVSYEVRQGCASYRLAPRGDLVLAVRDYNAGGIGPGAGWDHTIYLQITPELAKEGQKLVIPDTGVRPFLSWMAGGYCDATKALTGRLEILRVEDQVLEGWLEVQADDLKWSYADKVVFESAKR